MFRYDASPTEARAPVAAQRAGFGLTDIIWAVWRQKFLILGLGVLFAALTAVYAATLKDRYQATSQILIDPRELRIIGSEGTPNNLSGDAVTAFLESQTRIISSSNTMRKIVDREGLTRDSDYAAAPSILSRLIPTGQPRDETAAIVEQLRRNLWVRRGERTFVIDVSVIASSPEKSARITNAFAAAYLDDQANARAEASRRTSGALTARLSELRERVRASEDKVETYKTQKNIVGASGKLINEEQLQALNNQLAFARTRLADSRAKLDQAESVRGQAAERGAIPEAVNSQTLGILRQQLGEAQRRVATLTAALGPQHPELLAAQQSLRDAQRGVGEEIARIRQAARAEFDRSVANERAISTEVDKLKQQTLSTGRDAVELRELERELESNRVVYQAFLNRARETSEIGQIDSTNARIITTATPPLERVGPPRRLMVLAAGFGGLFLGALLALAGALREWFSNRTEAAPSASVADPAITPSETAKQPAAQWQQEAFRPQGQAAQTAPSSPGETTQAEADLMRVLRMIGQLEKAIDRYGMPK